MAAKGLIADADRAAIDQRIAEYAEHGLPKAWRSAWRIMHLLPPSLDIVRIASTTGVPVEQVGRTYFAVGARFGLDWLRRAAAALPSENHWDKQAVVAVIDDLYGHQRDLTTRILTAVAKCQRRRSDRSLDLRARTRRPPRHLPGRRSPPVRFRRPRHAGRRQPATAQLDRRIVLVMRPGLLISVAVMPAEAGIHIHGPVFMDTGFRRHDSQGCKPFER